MEEGVIIPRIVCLVIGYFFGCILSASVIVRIRRRVSVFQIGTGNPGMANVMAQCGFRDGIMVLIGDVLKVIISFVICYLIYKGQIAAEYLAAYAGLGATLGHDFPFWHRFIGGKGVACTCAMLFCIHPLCGLAAMIIGMILCFVTKYLSIGAVLIPLAFLPAAGLLYGTEMLILCVILSVLSFLKNLKSFQNIRAGKEKKIDLLRKISGRD